MKKGEGTAPMSEASATDQVRQDLDRFRDDFELLRREVGKVIVGLSGIVEETLTALIAGGHVLLEGVPGLGKTLLVRTLADALQLRFQRIQFTPDLMPADLIGTNVMLETPEGIRRFEFQRGPIFANLLLADEINRATPKTQSALLEAMQERSVTVAGTTHVLVPPFFVLATQNPLEMEGTYPLPEVQLDRFFFKLLVKFPSALEMETILDRTTEAVEPHAQPVFDGGRII
jgi:MoxR-like ATPase